MFDLGTLFGVLIAVIGNIFISISLVCQKHAHNIIKKANTSNLGIMIRPERQHFLDSSSSADEASNVFSEGAIDSRSEIRAKPFYKQPIWWVGFVTMFLGESGNIFAYGFAPAAVIAPLGTVALVANAIIAPFYLNEKFRPRDIFGIALATAGTVLVVYFSTNSDDQIKTPLSMDDIVNLFKSWVVIIYVVASLLVMAMLLVASRKFGTRFVMIDILLIALFGSYTIVSVKALTLIVRFNFVSLWTHWFSYLLLFIFAGTAALQLRFLNLALERFDSNLVTPLQFVFFNVSTIATSALIYNDFKDLPLLNFWLFLAGCFLDFLGVYLIAGGRHRQAAFAEVDPLNYNNEEDMLLVDPDITFFRYSSDRSRAGLAEIQSYPINNTRTPTETSSLLFNVANQRQTERRLSINNVLKIIASSVGTRHSSIFNHIYSPGESAESNGGASNSLLSSPREKRKDPLFVDRK